MRTPDGNEIDAWVSAAEAGEYLRVSRSRIGQLIRGGKLQARRSSFVWLVSGHSVCARMRALLRGE